MSDSVPKWASPEISAELASIRQTGESELVDFKEMFPEQAHRLAKEIAANPSPQLKMIKQLLTDNGAETDLDLVQKREGEALKVAYKSKEHKEAVQAFIEKRAPDFNR